METDTGKRKKNEKQRKGIYWQKSITATVGVILLVAALSYLLVCWINDREEQKCFDRLYEEAADLAENIENGAKNDREELELLAEIIADYDDISAERLWSVLDSFSVVGLMSRIEILMPDNTILMKGGQRLDAGADVSFEEEAARGAYISGREEDMDEDGGYIVRNCVPIVKDGETVAILRGIIDLETLPEDIGLKPYDGEAAVYIIEGKTGNFLMDTWHNELGNIWELGERRMASGYDHEQLKKGVTEGKSNCVVFVSKTIGKYLYFYYTPMEINDWRLALSVPKDVAFKEADEIHKVMNLFMMLEAICFIIYFIWMLRNTRREMEEKQRQMNTVNYIYDVQKLLFNAHESRESIIKVLEEISRIISADNVAFWIVNEQDFTPFVWRREGIDDKVYTDSGRIAEKLLEHLKNEEAEVEAENLTELCQLLPEGVWKKTGRTAWNLAAVPVKDKSGEISGILAASGVKDISAALALMRNMSFSFSMLLENVKSYDDVRERGERDALTGLYNRNRYETDIQGYEKKCKNPVACIYMDVNFLHELNNEKGHEAGDEMLKTVAEKIIEIFGDDRSYRIGGDEFVIFAEDTDRKTAEEQTEKTVADLGEKNIHISTGLHWEQKLRSVSDAVRSAEKKMYEEKAKYYDKKDRGRKVRNN